MMPRPDARGMVQSRSPRLTRWAVVPITRRMNQTHAAEAAEILRHHWKAGTRLSALPISLRPSTRAEGYAIAAHLATGAAYGWKIAATSQAGQRHIGVIGPLAGRIEADRVHALGTVVSLAGNHMRLAEPEFAFRLARPLPARAMPYTLAEAMDAVATLHPAIELPDSRFADVATAGEAHLIAELACGRDFVLGLAAPDDWRTLDLSHHPVTARVSDGPEASGGGFNVLGDPRVALAWLVNELSALGISLAAGEVVTTGTCIPPLPIAPGDSIVADFGVLGVIRVSFGP